MLTDPTARTLLVAIAHGDLDSAPVLADRLEELGDDRAASVRIKSTARTPALILALFPEGPRWYVRDLFGEPLSFLTPEGAQGEIDRWARHIPPGYLLVKCPTPTGPFYPS